ncbi:unnamed protein product, partial [Effrenium voratum]
MAAIATASRRFEETVQANHEGSDDLPKAKKGRFLAEGYCDSLQSDSTPQEKRPVLPLLRRLLTEVNRRSVQSPEELLGFEELADFWEATTPTAEDSAKIAQLRKQLSTALHQFFRSRWPIAKADWTPEEMARGLDRPTGNRSLGEFQVDLSASGVPYINAARIPGLVPGVSFVATQHPLPSTVEHFWHMVLQLQPTVIVMLNGHSSSEDLQDGYALAPYWEQSSVRGFDLDIQEVRHEKASDCCVRMLSCKRGSKAWQGPQLAVPWWRDQSEPDWHLFLELNKLVDSFLTPGKSHSVFVHCAGGIGRA